MHTDPIFPDGDTAGPIGTNKVDLASFDFGSVHSAEFNFSIFYTKSFYDRVLTKFQLVPNP